MGECPGKGTNVPEKGRYKDFGLLGKGSQICVSWEKGVQGFGCPEKRRCKDLGFWGKGGSRIWISWERECKDSDARGKVQALERTPGLSGAGPGGQEPGPLLVKESEGRWVLSAR